MEGNRMEGKDLDATPLRGKTRRRRWRNPTAKPGELLVRWGKSPHEGPDLFFCWNEGASKRDSNMVINCFEPLVKELRERGYDLTTLRFSVFKAGLPAPSSPKGPDPIPPTSSIGDQP